MPLVRYARQQVGITGGRFAVRFIEGVEHIAPVLLHRVEEVENNPLDLLGLIRSCRIPHPGNELRQIRALKFLRCGGIGRHSGGLRSLLGVGARLQGGGQRFGILCRERLVKMGKRRVADFIVGQGFVLHRGGQLLLDDGVLNGIFRLADAASAGNQHHAGEHKAYRDGYDEPHHAVCLA